MKRLMIMLCAGMLCAMSAQAQLVATDNANVNCNGSVQITATPADGFHFVKWTKGTEEFATNPLTIDNIKSVAEYVATFAADETAVDPSIDPGVTLPVAHGTTLSITPKTDDDCLEFDHWSDITDATDPLYNANPRSFEYNGVAPTFSAVFKTKVFNVTVNTSTGTTSQGGVSIVVLQ